MTVIPPTLVIFCVLTFVSFPTCLHLPVEARIVSVLMHMNKTPAPSTGPGSNGHQVEIGWMTEWMDDEGVWKASLTIAGPG